MTAARIKAVLGLAKSHERALTTALDAKASLTWTGTTPEGDLYERLRTLLGTIKGRNAYEKARSDFEKIKTKRIRRADFFSRLVESCRKEALGQSGAGGYGCSYDGDLIELFAEGNAWARLAEVIWAESVMIGDTEHFLDVIADYPELRPYLEEVQAGLIQAEDDEDAPIPENEGETAELADHIRRIAENLDVEHLDEREMRTLSIAGLRLANIAKARNIRDHDISLQRAQVEEWETRHADAISGADMVADALAVLKVRVERGGMDRESVGATLDLAKRLLAADIRYRETHDQLNRASSEGDLALVRTLADDLEGRGIERDEARAAIDSALPEPKPEGPAPKAPPAGDQAEPSGPESTGHEADPEEPQRRDSESVPNMVIPVQNALKSVSGDGLAPGGEGEGGEPDAEIADDTARPDDDEDGGVQRIEDAIASAIKCGRLGLAYHLARAAPDALPSANTVKLVACNYVTDERTPIGAELPDLAAALLDEAKATADEATDQPCRRDHMILTTCAALAPALAAPGGPVAQLLSLLEPRLDDMTSLRALARTAADVSMTGVHLPIALLREDDSLDKWRDREQALRNETTTWVTSEGRSTIKFHAATRVWRRMLEDWEHGGRSSLGHMFGLLDSPAEEINVERVSQISEYWRAHQEKEIDRIDRENRSRASTSKIEGPARSTLRGKANQALAFSDRWLSLIRERPDKRPPFHTKQAGVLRAAVNGNVDQALTEIDAVSTPAALGAGALLRRYTALFKGADEDADGVPIGLTELLNGDLLANPDIAFDDTGQLSASPLYPDDLEKLVSCDTPDFGHAAVERARRGDFFGAEAAIGFAERTGRIDEGNADRSRAMIDEQRAHVQRQLQDRIRETSDRLDAAYAEGALTLETYEQQNGSIPQDDLSETKAYTRLFETLHDIDNEITNAKAGRRDAIRRSLDTLNRLSPDERNRIDLAVDTGLFQVAEDFIERIERGEKLPALVTPSDRPFDQFFPHFVENYSVFGDKGEDGIVHARHVIESRDSADFIDASGLSEDACRDGIGILDAWAALGDSQTSIGSLRALMSAFGFERAKVTGSNDKTNGGERIFVCQAAPVADRGIARLPDFGSRADGRYRLFAVRGRATEEAIIREAGKRNYAGSSPNIVLFLGVLDAGSRCALAREFNSGEYHPTIVLDEALVVFLAAWGGNRLGAFFDCASAFTFSQPFDPDAAELPPEMFFGRAAARRAILAMSGDMTHFVYGGRRLGKTTLLADIAREHRTRRQGQSDELVLLINLKGSGIGENRPTEDLWPLFAEHLAEHGVLQPQTVRSDSIEKGVRQWLGKKVGRRILLLVDEADAFLDAERRPKQGYRVLEQVKRLMEQTERKFKVVFVGLHNVQRAARDPNTPFAHLGEAVRIGPMLPEIDGDEIQNLIRSPLEALGYRFVSNDSVIRIAAETNYYPALAQQFCKELLRTLRDEADTRGEAGPPYPILPDMVDRVFNARETRNRIRNLFSWTIQLDPRYEFLTYLIAQKSFDNEDARPQAMPIADIREAALAEWREGFSSDHSFWMFELLLEEMIGLGVLRETSDKQYTIRTRNLRMLLGSDDEIGRRFADAKSKIAPAIFDPAQFRNTLNDETPSSLSADQENRLLSGRYAVGLIFGTRLAGLDRLRDSLERAGERRDGSLYIQEVAPAALRPALGRLSRSRKRGTHVLLVDMRGAWDPEAVDHTLAFVKEHDGQNRIVRPVFICGPEEAWKRLREPLPTHAFVECREVWLGPCARDFTRTWLTDRESLAYSSMENPDQPVDLPWPATAGMAAKCKHLESIDEAAKATLNDDGDNHYVSDMLISANTDTALRLLTMFSDESMTADFLSDLSRDEDASMSPEEVIDFFGWADRLGVVCRDGHGYRLDSTYAAGLERIFQG